MSNFLRKLTSRKLWMAIAGIATGIAMVLGVDASDVATVAGAVTAIVSVVTYIAVEGRIDAEGVKNTIELSEDALELFEKEGE